jgi:transposase InsO family protein
MIMLEKGSTKAYTARYFSISRKCVKKWYDRFLATGVAGLLDHSRCPHTRRRPTRNPTYTNRLITLKETHPCWGRSKLRTYYHTLYGVYLSEWYIQRVIREHHLQWCPTRRKRHLRRASHPRIQKLPTKGLIPWELVHLDSVELRLPNGQRRYAFTAMDHVTREATGLIASSKHSKHAKRLIDTLLAVHPEITNIHTDNGGDMHGDLDQNLTPTHWVSRPYTPTDNARLERFHKTLQDECFPSANTYETLSDMEQRLNSWLTVYNTVRPHAALGNLTPKAYAARIAPPATHVVI